MTRDLADVFHPGTIAGNAERLYELRKQIAALKSEEENLTRILKAYCEKTGEVIEVEGLPALRPVPQSRGMSWDSHAIQKLQDDWPAEWQKLVELGAVSLSGTVIRDCIKRGQLVRMPQGGIERSVTALRFDRETPLAQKGGVAAKPR